MRAPARWVATLCLGAAALSWIGPSAAFEYAHLATRSLSVDVKADASAYNAPYLPACTAHTLTASTCSWYIYVNGSAPQKFTITKQTSSTHISRLDADGNQGNATDVTGNLKNENQSTAVVVNLNSCASSCETAIDFMIEGANANVLTTREEFVRLTVSWVL